MRKTNKFSEKIIYKSFMASLSLELYTPFQITLSVNVHSLYNLFCFEHGVQNALDLIQLGSLS